MKKKSAAVALAGFNTEVGHVEKFIANTEAADIPNSSKASCHDYAVVSLYRAFEEFVLDITVARINRDPKPLYDAVGVSFGKNPTVAQCEYLLVGDDYFNFRGHSGFVDVLKKAAGSQSAMVAVAKAQAHRHTFELLSGLRNYAAHKSEKSKNAALNAMRHWEPDRQNLGQAGNWLRISIGGQTRMNRLLIAIKDLAQDIANSVAAA